MYSRQPLYPSKVRKFLGMIKAYHSALYSIALYKPAMNKLLPLLCTKSFILSVSPIYSFFLTGLYGGLPIHKSKCKSEVVLV